MGELGTFAGPGCFRLYNLPLGIGVQLELGHVPSNHIHLGRSKVQVILCVQIVELAQVGKLSQKLEPEKGLIIIPIPFIAKKISP